MAILHLLANPAAASSCLDVVAERDSLLLIGEGVFALPTVVAAEPAARVGCLADDAQRLGVAPTPGVLAVSDAEFVAWVVECRHSVTWT